MFCSEYGRVDVVKTGERSDWTGARYVIFWFRSGGDDLMGSGLWGLDLQFDCTLTKDLKRFAATPMRPLALSTIVHALDVTCISGGLKWLPSSASRGLRWFYRTWLRAECCFAAMLDVSLLLRGLLVAARPTTIEASRV